MNPGVPSDKGAEVLPPIRVAVGTFQKTTDCDTVPRPGRGAARLVDTVDLELGRIRGVEALRVTNVYCRSNSESGERSIVAKIKHERYPWLFPRITFLG